MERAAAPGRARGPRPAGPAARAGRRPRARVPAGVRGSAVPRAAHRPRPRLSGVSCRAARCERRRAVPAHRMVQGAHRAGRRGLGLPGRDAEDRVGRRLAVRVRPRRPRRLHLAPRRDGPVRRRLGRRQLRVGLRLAVLQPAAGARGRGRTVPRPLLQRRHGRSRPHARDRARGPRLPVPHARCRRGPHRAQGHAGAGEQPHRVDGLRRRRRTLLSRAALFRAGRIQGTLDPDQAQPE